MRPGTWTSWWLLGTFPLHLSQARQSSFQLPHLNCPVSSLQLLSELYWALPKPLQIQTSVAGTALISSLPWCVAVVSWQVGKITFASNTASHEQSKIQPSPSYTVSMFGRSSKEQSENPLSLICACDSALLPLVPFLMTMCKWLCKILGWAGSDFFHFSFFLPSLLRDGEMCPKCQTSTQSSASL